MPQGNLAVSNGYPNLMSYLVLARKWRPQNFGDIVGQEHITRILTNAILYNRIAHCYLFTGVRGVGKTTAARILAKALNCEKGPTPEPCNECTHCTEIVSGNSMDVYEVDGASNRGIDEVRQIIENSRYQPAKSRFKIYIIDEVHQVTKDAFNALLKTLEEPPPFVRFILATTEAHRLPDTIRSRCQRFDFRRIRVMEMTRKLQEIAEVESLRITENALLLIAREAQGSMRDAQSLLEQVLSYAAPGLGEEGAAVEVDERLLQDILGIAERKILYDICGAVIQGKPDRCIEMVADASINGLDLPRLSQELVEHFRNLLVARLVLDQGTGEGPSGSPSRASGSLFDLHDQEIAGLRAQVADLSVESLMDFFRVMVKGDEDIARSAYPRFALETTLVRLATLPKSIAVSNALERLSEIEQRLSGGEALEPSVGAPVTASSHAVTDEKVESIQPTPSDPSGLDQSSEEKPVLVPTGGPDEFRLWGEFVSFVMKEKRFLASHLEQVRPLKLPPGQLKIGVEDRHHLSYLQDRENLSALKDFASRFFSGDVSVTVAPLAGEPKATDSSLEGASPSTAAQDGIVGEALRIFGGSIKEIK